jgi:hypothetical protein
MASQVGLTIIKSMTYRGVAGEEWSNTYHFSGGIPSDATAWKTLADALIAQEKTLYVADSVVVRAYGYDSDSDTATAVWSYDYLAAAATVPGTCATTGSHVAAGDQAAWIRWPTGRLNSKGKPIYLRKYYHHVPVTNNTATGSDDVGDPWDTTAAAFGTKMRDGSFADSRVITARGHSDTPASSQHSVWVTTRTLKRRGKRPGA